MAEEEKKEEASVKETAPKIEEKPEKKEQPAGAKPEQPAQQGRVKASNCAVCNKVLKRGNWYYRNGNFFCNKRCWKKSTEKAA